MVLRVFGVSSKEHGMQEKTYHYLRFNNKNSDYFFENDDRLQFKLASHTFTLTSTTLATGESFGNSSTATYTPAGGLTFEIVFKTA